MNTEIDTFVKIENMIYEINGKQIMLDSDLAKLYHVETKRINEAVKNNPQKFPERFSWKLTDIQSKNFLVENFDQKIETRGGKYKNPRVFTEQGVAMLATILKTSVAIKTSIQIMDAFVAMRKYISNDLIRQDYIKDTLLRHDNEIKLLQESFNKFEEKRKVNEIYFNGQIYDAYSKILDIMITAKNELIVIDNYADKTLLDIFRRINCQVILLTKKTNELLKADLLKYNKQYNNLKVVYNDDFHDRYFIIDRITIYHCGTSVNYAGSKIFSINLLEDKIVKEALIKNIEKLI